MPPEGNVGRDGFATRPTSPAAWVTVYAAIADPRAARRAIYRIADIPLTRSTRQHD